MLYGANKKAAGTACRVKHLLPQPGIYHIDHELGDGLWQLDGHNDWFAKLSRKGETLHIGEPPAEYDTLEVWHRYWREPLEAIKPWLEYRFSPKGNLVEKAE